MRGWTSGDLTSKDVHIIFYFLLTILYYFPIIYLPFQIVPNYMLTIRFSCYHFSQHQFELVLWDNSARDSVSSLNFSVWFEFTSCKYENSSSITFFSLHELPNISKASWMLQITVFTAEDRILNEKFTWIHSHWAPATLEIEMFQCSRSSFEVRFLTVNTLYLNGNIPL